MPIMNIKITDAEVAGIKEYLKEVCEVENPGKLDVEKEIGNILNSYFQAQHSSLTDYIQKHEKLQK
jgi:hypothetical protein